MDQAAYLKRIDYKGNPDTTLETLQELQQKHLFSIPFENLDIHYGNEIILDINKFYDKIVNRNRGGFCYELNGLFCSLLKSIGFDARMISARVYEEDNEFSPEYDHMAIIVRINEAEYLVDVGFGEFIYQPLKINLGEAQQDVRETYRITHYDDTYLQVGKRDDGGWTREYIFNPTGRELSEFQPRCDFHQTSSESHFQKKKVCSLPTKAGRLTVSGDKIKIKKDGKTEETELGNEAEFREALWKHFQIAI